jgi:ABC-type branched-subunit amino acid transport system permease subunit
MFIQLLANGLVTGSVIALAAAGVSIVYGILRLVNFAYGDYMTFGAFIAVYFNVTQTAAHRSCGTPGDGGDRPALCGARARTSGGNCARAMPAS